MAKSSRQGKATRTWQSEQYPNAPVSEVVFELRFSGEPAIECRRDDYYATVRHAFPVVMVPTAEAGKPLSVEPYFFKSEDDTETIATSINRFAYMTTQYGGFADFKPRALELAEGFAKRFEIRELRRMGLRYTNVMPFIRDAGRVPWEQFFTVKMNLPLDGFDSLMNAALSYESKCDGGAITTRIACVRSNTADEAFVLDFDFAKTEGVTVASLPTAIQEAHDYTNRVFEGIVTEQYRAVMRGQVIE